MTVAKEQLMRILPEMQREIPRMQDSDAQQIVNLWFSIKPKKPATSESKADEDAERKRAAGKRAFEALESMRMQVQASGEPEMTLDEINAEISAARADRKRARA